MDEAFVTMTKEIKDKLAKTPAAGGVGTKAAMGQGKAVQRPTDSSTDTGSESNVTPVMLKN